MERAAANRRLRKLAPVDLSAEDILAVDDSAYGEREEELVKRTAEAHPVVKGMKVRT
jgi:hypothetical protein